MHLVFFYLSLIYKAIIVSLGHPLTPFGDAAMGRGRISWKNKKKFQGGWKVTKKNFFADGGVSAPFGCYSISCKTGLQTKVGLDSIYLRNPPYQKYAVGT